MAEMQDSETHESSELETVEQQIGQQEQGEKTDLPMEYKGKSVEDVIKMHQEAVRLSGRQSQEIAEVRRLADELIKSQLQKKPEDQPKEVDFFENPQEAIRKAVDTNPKVQAAEQYALQAQRVVAMQTLAQKHPDFQTVVADQEFANWVKASPVRIRLFQEGQNYNVDSADELLSTFKALKAVRQEKTNETEKAARDSALKAASVHTGGSGESGKKIFRRADLINLRISNPAKFSAMQDEIDRAYAEGRVK